MDLKAEEINKTKISGVVRYDDLRNILADVISKSSGLHRQRIYEGLVVDYEPGDEGKFGRLIINVSIDHNQTKPER